jgi:uncharacterized protein YeaO (DUF488 family)
MQLAAGCLIGTYDRQPSSNPAQQSQASRLQFMQKFQCACINYRTMPIYLKRIYDKPARNDGYRVLIDRMWPRGLTKGQAQVDAWLKALAPSPELRRWFNHDPDKWETFKNRYFKELDESRETVEQLATKARGQRLTLVFAAKNRKFNNAVALKEYLEQRQV